MNALDHAAAVSRFEGVGSTLVPELLRSASVEGNKIDAPLALAMALLFL
jgi:hypothetical protein